MKTNHTSASTLSEFNERESRQIERSPFSRIALQLMIPVIISAAFLLFKGAEGRDSYHRSAFMRVSEPVSINPFLFNEQAHEKWKAEYQQYSNSLARITTDEENRVKAIKDRQARIQAARERAAELN